MSCGNWEDITDNWETITDNWEDIGECVLTLDSGGEYIVIIRRRRR